MSKSSLKAFGTHVSSVCIQNSSGFRSTVQFTIQLNPRTVRESKNISILLRWIHYLRSALPNPLEWFIRDPLICLTCWWDLAPPPPLHFLSLVSSQSYPCGHQRHFTQKKLTCSTSLSQEENTTCNFTFYCQCHIHVVDWHTLIRPPGI